VVNWPKFNPDEHDISFNDEKLAVRDITRYDVMEVLWNGVYAIRDKQYPNRYRVRGRTDAGRPLELIAEDQGKKRLRFITGWPI
jgi:hypothetical protein